MGAKGWKRRPAPRSVRGQSTVEYMIALMALLALVLAMGQLWRAIQAGGLTHRAESGASHQVGGDDALGAWKDVSLF